jgi:hypothetical protein
MVKKLKSLLPARILSPLFKTAVFVGLFWLLAWTLNFWVGVLYVMWGGFLHATLFNRKSYSPFFLSFLSVYVFGFVLALTLPPGAPVELIGLVLGALLFVVWGVYAPLFSRHRLYASIFYYVFFFAVSAWASAEIFSGGWWLVPLVGAGFYAITREYVLLFLDGWNRRANVFVVILSLLVIEEIFLASLSSIGALAVASLAMVFVLVALDLYAQATRGVLTRDAVYKNAVLFAGLSGLVLVVPLFFGR